MTPADPSRRLRLQTSLLLLAVFAAGVVTGAGVLRWLAPRPEVPRAASPTALAPPLPAARLPRELRLTPEQEERAREIGERYRPELEALAKEMKPRVRAVQDRMEGEFLALLTPEQRQQLAAIEERRKHPPRPGAVPPAPPAGQASADPLRAPPDQDRPARPPTGRRPPPPESIEACRHLDLDQLCRFTRNGGEHEGSCRRGPDGTEPLHCAPDRHMEQPPPQGQAR